MNFKLVSEFQNNLLKTILESKQRTIGDTLLNLIKMFVCLALQLLGGNSFFRIKGVCNRSSKATAHRHLWEVVDKLCMLKEATVHMPNANMMRQNIDAVKAKYHLPNVVGNIFKEKLHYSLFDFIKYLGKTELKKY